MARRSRGQRRRHAVQQRKQSERRRAETDDTQQASRLMALPAELRNRIWTYVFEGSVQELRVDGFYTPGMKGLWRDPSGPPPTTRVMAGSWSYYTSPPPLLSTCKQVYTEAIGIYYSTTTFLSKVPACEMSAEKLVAWMKKIGPERAKLIGNVRFFVSALYRDMFRFDYQELGDLVAFDRAAMLLETVENVVAREYDNGPCISGNLWYFDDEGGFEIWTSKPLQTDQEVRQAWEQGPESFEDWLVRKGNGLGISRWEIEDTPGISKSEKAAAAYREWSLDAQEHWVEELLDAFDKWYMETHSEVARFHCGCGRYPKLQGRTRGYAPGHPINQGDDTCL
ncbi:unnamed protein product [Cercospora beticola]|nr:unnamed protein product [Cercospora beticola]